MLHGTIIVNKTSCRDLGSKRLGTTALDGFNAREVPNYSKGPASYSEVVSAKYYLLLLPKIISPFSMRVFDLIDKNKQ